MGRSVVLIILSLFLCLGARAQQDTIAVQVDTLDRPADIGSGLPFFAKGHGAPVDTLDVGDVDYDDF